MSTPYSVADARAELDRCYSVYEERVKFIEVSSVREGDPKRTALAIAYKSELPALIDRVKLAVELYKAALYAEAHGLPKRVPTNEELEQMARFDHDPYPKR
jgi:hypothetical protein